MLRLTITAGGIAFKIWFFAVLINALLSVLLTAYYFLGTSAYLFVITMLFVGFFSALFSIPIFVFISILLSRLLKKGYPKQDIFLALLIAGCVSVAGIFGLYCLAFSVSDSDGVWFCIVGIVSGSAAIGISYPNIKKACQKRDDAALTGEYVTAHNYLNAFANK